MATVWSVLMLIDGAIYNLICYVYEIFYYLATLNIFTEEHYQGIVNRIYVVLGLFMLFVLAYSLLKAIIDPDNFAKKENSFPNLIKNVIISLVIIVLLPTVFSVAFNIQNAVLNNDTIPKLILGLDGSTEDTSGGGRTIAYYLYKAFLYPNSDYCVSEGYTDIEECRDSIKGNGWLFVTNGDQLTVMDQAVLNGSSFTNYNDYSESVRDGKLSYLFPISTVAGIFTLYVLLNFCFDMAIRVVKLAFYQIIAPIPVICRVMPGGKMKEVFDKWVQQIISIFLEVFIRIAVLAIGIYLINIVVETYNNGLPNIDSLGLTQRPIVLALIIMGIVIFMRQAPQILGDLLGLKTDGMKLGLMDKLAMGGGLLAGAAVGGGVTSALRNYNATRAQGGGRLNAIRSAIGGAGSGALRSGFNAKGAKNFKDMAGAASKGITAATEKKAKRALYKANHGGTVAGAIAGHFTDFGKTVTEWSGAAPSLESLKGRQESINYVNSSIKDLEDSARNLVESDAGKNKANDYGITSTFASTNQALQARITANGINVANYNTGVLRQLQQAKAAATAGGGQYQGISIADWENMISEYTDKFGKAVANQGLLNKSGIAALGDKNRNDLKDIIISGTKLRGAIQDSMTSSFVSDANITPSFIAETNSIDINSQEISDLKDNLKKESTDVGIAIAQKRNEEKKKNSNENK